MTRFIAAVVTVALVATPFRFISEQGLQAFIAQLRGYAEFTREGAEVMAELLYRDWPIVLLFLAIAQVVVFPVKTIRFVYQTLKA